ncbi:MAG: PAS domain S-box protein [Polyangiaceae bacterium]|nr:PAS domain S-box protein [Polyangiaceae bacterium]
MSQTSDEIGFRVETERLRALVASIGLGVLVEDENRRVVLANEALCTLWLIPLAPSALVGTDCSKTAQQLAPMVRDSDRWVSRIDELLKDRKAVTGDEVVLNDGRVFERDYVPISVDSVERGHLWVYRDVTESRKHARLERAAAVRDGLRLAIDAIPGLVWSSRADGYVEFVNQRWCDYTGLTLEEATGQGWEAVVLPEDLAGLREHFQTAIATGQAMEAEARLRRFDGVYRWFLFRAVRSPGVGDQPDKWYGQIIDIDDRKRSAEALQNAQAELSHVSRVTTLGELAASIAHEINQPISAMVADATAALNWLDRQPPDLAKARESLAAIVADGTRGGDILTRIRALLARSTHTHGRFDLADTIQSALRLVRSDLARQRIALSTSVSLDGFEITGDPIELQQVLLNLLLNAAEASRDLSEQRRRVTVHARIAQEDGAAVAVVSVEDAGVGLDEKQIDRLFAPFYSTKPGGLGMGLSIIRSIIDRHGGRIWAAANPEHGATFHFVLPGQAAV